MFCSCDPKRHWHISIWVLRLYQTSSCIEQQLRLSSLDHRTKDSYLQTYILCILRIDLTMTPRHVYWATCRIPLSLNVRFITVVPLLPTAMQLFLFSLTLIKLREQNFKSPLYCFCIPFSDLEINVKSLDQNIWAVIFSLAYISYSDSRDVFKSVIYLRTGKLVTCKSHLNQPHYNVCKVAQPTLVVKTKLLINRLRKVSITFPYQTFFYFIH